MHRQLIQFLLLILMFLWVFVPVTALGIYSDHARARIIHSQYVACLNSNDLRRDFNELARKTGYSHLIVSLRNCKVIGK